MTVLCVGSSRLGDAAPQVTGEAPDVTEASLDRDGLGGRVDGDLGAKQRSEGVQALLHSIQKRDREIGRLLERITSLTNERNLARSELNELRRRLGLVGRERTDLVQELETIRKDIGEWAQEVDALREEARAGRQGARYLAGSRKELLENGIISGGFLRRVSLRRLERLEILDLTRDTEIVFRGSEHGLTQIQKVRVLPEGFERDQDYAVALLNGGEAARVSLLDVNKFRRSTFVVVLE